MPVTSNTIWLRGRRRKFAGWAKDWIGQARWTKTGRMAGVVRQVYLRWHAKPITDNEATIANGYVRSKKATFDDRPHFAVDTNGVAHQFLDTIFASPQSAKLDVPYSGCIIIENMGEGDLPTSAQIEGVRRLLQAISRYHVSPAVAGDAEWPTLSAGR